MAEVGCSDEGVEAISDGAVALVAGVEVDQGSAVDRCPMRSMSLTTRTETTHARQRLLARRHFALGDEQGGPRWCITRTNYVDSSRLAFKCYSDSTDLVNDPRQVAVPDHFNVALLLKVRAYGGLPGTGLTVVAA